ncbi:GAGA Associated Factor [Ladona fulva]|uniref:GAGA Associated Factor n=1 Tax=Ladona fulva TaxID=123851 RepID=A0A8K0K9N6_LADFU|nr:GAGA Associated Factor [Ladona fulva]
MGSTQLCSLAWGEFGSSLVSAVQLLRCHGDLVDVTLAAGGRSFPAHKIVLCAASPYLLDLLKNAPCKHPIVMLAGVAAHDLEALLEFVYRGEVSVDPNQLPSLLQAAHCLNIQGLAPAAVSSEKLDELGMGSTVHQNLTRDVINSFLPVRRRKRNKHKGMCSNRGGRGGGSGLGGGKWAREMNHQDGEDGIAGEGGSDGGGAAGSDDHDDVKVSEGQRTGTDGESSAAPNEEDSGKKSGVSDQPAVCPLCGATLRQSRNLRRHLELLHFGVSRGASSIRVKSRTVPQRHTEQRQDHEEHREGESGGEGSSPTPIALVSTAAPTHHAHALSMVVPANPMMVIDPQMCGRNGDHDPGDRSGGSRICEPAPILGCVLGAPPIHHLAVQPPHPPPTDLIMRRHQDDVAAMYPERRSPPSQGGSSHRVDVV